MNIQRRQLKDYLAAKKLRSHNAIEAALWVREELLSCMQQGRHPEIPADTLADAKSASPQGGFPSHSTLLTLFAHEL